VAALPVEDNPIPVVGKQAGGQAPACAAWDVPDRLDRVNHALRTQEGAAWRAVRGSEVGAPFPRTAAS